MKLTKTMESKVAEFGEELQKVAVSWAAAGRLLVEMLDEDPTVIDVIQQRYPVVSRGALAQLEAVGRGVFDERLLTAATPGALSLRKMPVSVQRRYLDAPVELVVETDGGTDILLVELNSMTARQARQVFSARHVRSASEQKAWMAEHRVKKSPDLSVSIPAWTIRNNRVVFQEGATLSAGELATILTQITR